MLFCLLPIKKKEEQKREGKSVVALSQFSFVAQAMVVHIFLAYYLFTSLKCFKMLGKHVDEGTN
jgi:hypothetical protein